MAPNKRGTQISDRNRKPTHRIDTTCNLGDTYTPWNPSTRGNSENPPPRLSPRLSPNTSSACELCSLMQPQDACTNSHWDLIIPFSVLRSPYFAQGCRHPPVSGPLKPDTLNMFENAGTRGNGQRKAVSIRGTADHRGTEYSVRSTKYRESR